MCQYQQAFSDYKIHLCLFDKDFQECFSIFFFQVVQVSYYHNESDATDINVRYTIIERIQVIPEIGRKLKIFVELFQQITYSTTVEFCYSVSGFIQLHHITPKLSCFLIKPDKVVSYDLVIDLFVEFR
jgi:hypothetical protein